MTAGQRLAAVAAVWTVAGGLLGLLMGLLLTPLTLLFAPCATARGGGQAAELAACTAGPSLALLAAEFAFLGLITAAVGLMVMPGMRLDFAQAQADVAAAAQVRALAARSRPAPLVPLYVMPLAFR